MVGLSKTIARMHCNLCNDVYGINEEARDIIWIRGFSMKYSTLLELNFYNQAFNFNVQDIEEHFSSQNYSYDIP